MAVKIRLTRMGAKKAPFYRIVATDGRKARDGQYIEQIGYYDPTKEPTLLKVDKEVAEKWLKSGAQPTDTVRRLFKDVGLIERDTYKADTQGAKTE
ncbi:MAG: 30S ribosomal protein S16 [Clostridiales bacterium]|jgi:small subunit ribosomal protein S16|nr:30S ribosomal protein S16 [Clostridiales bacterium]